MRLAPLTAGERDNGRVIALRRANGSPRARASAKPGGTRACESASGAYPWRDGAWMNARRKYNPMRQPVSIYRIRQTGGNGAPLPFEQLAAMLPQSMLGFTHVAIAPLAARSDADCVCLPEQLMRLIDLCHRANIGVILDCQATQSGAFLDEARRLLDAFHADGLCVVGVRSLLERSGKRGGRDVSGVAFLQAVTDTLHREFPGAMLLADECVEWLKVTTPASIGGLGFDLALNVGWADDLRAYVSTDCFYRRYRHDRLTSRLRVDCGEQFVLPLDAQATASETVQPFERWQHFAEQRALLGYTYACPGKKQICAWEQTAATSDEREPLTRCVQALNRVYRETPALYARDDLRGGFCWCNEDDVDNSVVAFLRTNGARDAALCVINFTPMLHTGYRIGLPSAGRLTELFNTDRAVYGGSDQYNAVAIDAEAIAWNGLPYSASIVAPPMSCVFFTYHTERRAARKARIGTPSQQFTQIKRRKRHVES